MKYLFLKFINLYQASLSPDHGWFKARFPYGYCKFYPSCSEYTKQAVMQKGLVVGISLGILRLAKCNPWSKGGVDMVSESRAHNH